MVKVSFKTIKIKDETYENLNVFKGELMKKLKRQVSIDEALRYLLKSRKNRPSKFAGGWNMDENEFEKINSELKESWRPSANSLSYCNKLQYLKSLFNINPS